MAFPWILPKTFTIFSTSTSSSSTCNLFSWTSPKLHYHPSTRGPNFSCKCGLSAEDELKFVLHDALDFSGIDTVHARVIFSSSDTRLISSCDYVYWDEWNNLWIQLFDQFSCEARRPWRMISLYSKVNKWNQDLK